MSWGDNITTDFDHVKGNDAEQTRQDLIRLRDNDPDYTELDWYNRGVGDEGIKALAEMLKKNTILNTLNIEYNRFGAEGVKAMAEMLMTNKTLNTLHISYNNIGAEGGKALAEMLMTNKTLNTLDISANNIRAKGGKAMAEMLETNKTLNTLNICNNDIGDEGGKAVAEMLETNTTLNSLAIYSNDIEYGNDIGNDLSSSITAFVASNHTLWKQQKEIMERSDDALSYYINGYVATPSPSTTDDSNNTHWMWTENAWKAINSTDGRINQSLLNCLKTVNIEANKASLKRLAEYDEKDGNLLLHIAATKTHFSVLNFLNFSLKMSKLTSIAQRDQGGPSAWLQWVVTTRKLQHGRDYMGRILADTVLKGAMV